MQRLLTVLVLVLLVAVAALGIAVYKLPDAGSQRQPATVRPAVPVPDPEAAAREAALERKIEILEDQIAVLGKELRERPAAPKASNPVESGGGGVGEGGYVVAPSPGLRARDENGQLVITEEDIEVFQKVQERVLRQQRVDSQAKSAMLRVDRMIQRGEIAPLAGDHRTEVEKVLRNVIATGDDLTQRLLRSPDERGLTGEQRRDELSVARTQLLASAQTELEPIVGADDAKRIAEESLQRPWGLGRPGRRFEDQR